MLTAFTNTRLSFLCLSFASLTCATTLQTYPSAATWDAAAAQAHLQVIHAGFDNDQLSLSGLTLTTSSGMGSVHQSGDGKVINDVWTDCVGKAGCAGNYDYTVLQYTTGTLMGIMADLTVSQTAHGLEAYLFGVNGTVAEEDICGAAQPFGGCGSFAGTWALISDRPFTSIMFATSQGDAWWTMKDVQVAVAPVATPEPTTLSVVGTVLLAAIAAAKHRQKRSA